MIIRAATLTPRQRRIVRDVRPLTPNQLHRWLIEVLDVHTPRAAIEPASHPPFDYLAHTFFERPPDDRSPDCVVWAARGGGKTFYAAVATLLDMLFKPGIEIKIVGGSLEQSMRMHEHLRRLLERPEMLDLTERDDRIAAAGRRAGVTERRIVLRNGSVCHILAQSHTSVRGARPQKLRCDEVELFDPAIWEAAQLVTRSARLAGRTVRGAVEALSTMHEPHGLMSRLVEPGSPRRIFRWGVVDVLERCPPERPCQPCPLAPECAGNAKHASGHIAIDDALALKARVGAETWEAEMLCRRPSRSNLVLAEFDRDAHVAAFDPPPGATWVGGMDFGFRAPTAILWGVVDAAGVLRIVDERIRSGVVVEVHGRAILDAPWPTPEWIGADPAGGAKSEQTGRSSIELLRRMGLCLRARRSRLHEGLRALRARLRPASGPPTLYIHERCTALIESIEAYRYPPSRPADDAPMKDGADHAVDALRYLVINLDHPYKTTCARYV